MLLSSPSVNSDTISTLTLLFAKSVDNICKGKIQIFW